jgi:signal transduction histidine kinase
LQGYFGPSRHRKNSPQVISNLLNNAFKSIKENGEGGTVTIDLENRVRAGGPYKNDREIVVSISDEGNGIDSKILSSLFSKLEWNRVRIVYV